MGEHALHKTFCSASADLYSPLRSFFNHYLTGEVNDDGEQTTPWWKETEMRTYVFLDGGEDATLKETDESVLRRGAMEDGLIINRPEIRGKVDNVGS